MNKKPFGLDIGFSSIKLVWLSKSGNGYLLNSSIIRPTPAGGMTSKSVLDEEEIGRSIRKAMQDANITSKYVNLALAENQVYTKVIEMPVLSDKELSSAIYWEAEQHIPVPLNTVSLVWKVLKRPDLTTSPNGKMQVLIVGAPIPLVEKYQRVVEKAGLYVNAVETEILAVVRALILDEKFPPTLIVTIGSLDTALAIVRQGVLVFNYTIPTGGNAINRAISIDYGLTDTQAEEYKRVYGVSGKALGGKIGQATQPILLSILAEVKKALVFYNEKYKDEGGVKQIMLSGGTAKLPGIDVFFASNSGIETVIANPWKVLAPQEIPKAILDNAADYTVAVGLAMREYGK